MLPHFVEAGAPDGHPVVLIHGFPFDHRQWQPQLDALTAHRLIALDMRGHGKTPVGPQPLMIEFLVDDLIELLDHLSLERASVCGLSMGGYVALRAIDRHPDRVHGLVLCDTRAQHDDNAGRVKRAEAIRAIRKDGMQAFARKMLPALFGEENVERDAPGVAAIRAQIEATSVEGACAALGAMACRLDLTDRLASIDTPTLIVVGELDALTPPADSEAMRDAIPGAELVVIPGAGHVSNLSDPETFTNALRALLSEVAAS